MKKLMAGILALVTLLGCAMAGSARGYGEEILFRGLPWMTDVETYANALADELCKDESEVASFWGKRVQIENLRGIYPTLYDVQSDKEGLFRKCGYDFTVVGMRDDVFVAGYPVIAIRGEALWGVEEGRALEAVDQSRVVRTTYQLDFEEIDLEDVWADLQSKLTGVYGEDSVRQDSSEEIQEVFRRRRLIWYGENNTYVMLTGRMEKEGLSHINVEYGRSDMTELIEEVRNAVHPSSKESTDGL